MAENYPSQYGAWAGGKGSTRRPLDEEKFRENYDNINWSDTEEEEQEEDND